MFENIKNIAPAALYQDQIRIELTKRMYTKEMHLLSGRIGNRWITNIDIDQQNWKFQFAMLDDNEKLIGYIGFDVDYVTSSSSHFALISFDPGNIIVGKVTKDIILECHKNFHRVEWGAQGDNPTLHNYIKICKKLGGDYFVLHDIDKDETGKYIDSYIFEVIHDDPIYK